MTLINTNQEELAFLNPSGLLLILDHLNYDDADAGTIEAMDDNLTQLSSAVSKSLNNYMIIVTSKTSGSHAGTDD